MTRPQVTVLVYTAIAAALVPLLSCDDGPTTPTPRGPTPPANSPVTTVSLELQAPSSIAPASSAQLTALAVRSDGSRQDVTGQAQWTSSNTAILQIGGDGLASAQARGEARVTVRHEGRSTAATVLVLPDGTFRVAGRITESGQAVSGARIEVIEGTGTGLAATSGFNGDYALYGVAGPIILHGKKASYANLIRTLTVNEHGTADFEMSLDRPRAALAGPYTLTLIAAGQCAANLPDAARRRTYEADVEQRGPELTVRLSGADFILANGRGNSFRGTHRPDDRIDFSIGESSYYYFYYSLVYEDLVERLTPTSAFVVHGGVNAVLDADRNIPGTVQGNFAITARMVWPFWPYSINCSSTGHRFELRRK